MTLFISKLLSSAALVSFFFCLLPVLRKTEFFKKFPCTEKILGLHFLWSLLLLTFSLLHGILVLGKPGIVSGKMAWTFLAVFLLFSWILKNRKRKGLLIFHRIGALFFSGMIFVHLFSVLG